MSEMSARELCRHYVDVRKRLMGKPKTWTRSAKKPWSTPSITIVWAKVKVSKHAQERTGRRTSVPQSSVLGKILVEVAIEYGFHPSQIISPCRMDCFVKARERLFYRAMSETNYPLTWIAKRYERDHTTVLYAVKQYCLLNGIEMPRDSTFKRRHWHGETRRYCRKQREAA